MPIPWLIGAAVVATVAAIAASSDDDKESDSSAEEEARRSRKQAEKERAASVRKENKRLTNNHLTNLTNNLASKYKITDQSDINALKALIKKSNSTENIQASLAALKSESIDDLEKSKNDVAMELVDYHRGKLILGDMDEQLKKFN